ncbi:hypothetical protein [Saccharopolyspora spinosa]|uniref:hypothetical protein n=1 Tax=Saccharopolyspora spinosa TaxID=60894 RepID=UPI000237A72F|nr:hypothetical protein [Saccharopolyspora spinosa]
MPPIPHFLDALPAEPLSAVNTRARIDVVGEPFSSHRRPRIAAITDELLEAHPR